MKNHNTVAASANLSLTFFTFPKCLQKAVASPHNSEQVQDLSPPQMKNFRAPQGFQGSDSARSRLRRRACTVARPRGGLNFGGGEGREGEALRPHGEGTPLPSSPQALSHRRPGSTEPEFPGSAAARLRMRGPGRVSRERAAPQEAGQGRGHERRRL